MGIENNFEPTIEMPEELAEHLEEDGKKLTPEQLAGGPKPAENFTMPPKQTGERIDWTEEPSDEEIAEQISNEINTAENMPTTESIETPTEPETPEQITKSVETDPEKIFENIKKLVEAEAGKYIPEGFLTGAKQQFNNKINTPGFDRERAITETISYLKVRMKLPDNIEALRNAAKIPYNLASGLVERYKANSPEVTYEDTIAKIQEAQKVAEEAKDVAKMNMLNLWISEVEELKKIRG